MNITTFTWGYEGWGSSAEQLKKATASIAQAQKSKRPFFVDLRLARTGRAPDFQRDKFEKRVGASYYRWMKSLGNLNISTGGSGVSIAEPDAAEELLGLIISKAKQKQRVIAFCWCGAPDFSMRCHRRTVASLLLKLAPKRGIDLTVAEWPGGKPKTKFEVVEISDDQMERVNVGQKVLINLGTRQPDKRLLALPWRSSVRLNSKSGDIVRAFADPPFCRGGKWRLSLPLGASAEGNLGKLLEQSSRHRDRYGLSARSSKAARFTKVR